MKRRVISVIFSLMLCCTVSMGANATMLSVPIFANESDQYTDEFNQLLVENGFIDCTVGISVPMVRYGDIKKPDLTYDEFVDLARKTVKNENGIMIFNINGVIEELKKEYSKTM